MSREDNFNRTLNAHAPPLHRGNNSTAPMGYRVYSETGFDGSMAGENAPTPSHCDVIIVQ